MMHGQVAIERDHQAIWRDHCHSAIKKFLMNAVVIDNQPVLSEKADVEKKVGAKAAIKSDDGMGEVVKKEETKYAGKNVDEEADEEINVDDQDLDIRGISDAFAQEEIACAFVLPRDNDPDKDSIFRRIIAAAISSDIVVIDWYLQDRDPSLTQKVLHCIAKQDIAERGRMRLICIYTGQPDTEEVTRLAVEALQNAGMESPSRDYGNGKARGKHHCLLVLNKKTVTSKELPSRIFDAFLDLSDGLLSSFALAAVAAIRRNVHHIVTRFSSELDAAYVANRLITDPPGDVAELIRQLFVSECDTALGLEKVADIYLDPEPITKWLNHLGQPIDTSCEINNGQKIDRDFIDSLLQNGIIDNKVRLANGNEIKFNGKKRSLVSKAFYGTEEKSINGERLFSRHVAFKREAFGCTKMYTSENWVPSLTLGTVLRQEIKEGNAISHKYFYCITPACDTIRLNDKERKFLMLELDEKKGKSTSKLIVIEGQNNYKGLWIDPRPGKISYFLFKGCKETGRILASRKEDGLNEHNIFLFKTSDGQELEFLWIGEVRRNRANRDMAELNREWLRFGINDSEYLRLAGKGDAEI